MQRRVKEGSGVGGGQQGVTPTPHEVGRVPAAGGRRGRGLSGVIITVFQPVSHMPEDQDLHHEQLNTFKCF